MKKMNLRTLGCSALVCVGIYTAIAGALAPQPAHANDIVVRAIAPLELIQDGFAEPAALVGNMAAPGASIAKLKKGDCNCTWTRPSEGSAHQDNITMPACEQFKAGLKVDHSDVTCTWTTTVNRLE